MGAILATITAIVVSLSARFRISGFGFRVVRKGKEEPSWFVRR